MMNSMDDNEEMDSNCENKQPCILKNKQAGRYNYFK